MATDADKPKVKAKVGKPPAAKKAAPAKKPAAKAESKKAAPKKAAATGGKLKVTQTGSAIARKRDQKATLIGLGLNKINRSRVLDDTPETRGMVRKVSHLVKVENVG